LLVEVFKFKRERAGGRRWWRCDFADSVGKRRISREGRGERAQRQRRKRENATQDHARSPESITEEKKKGKKQKIAK